MKQVLWVVCSLGIGGSVALAQDAPSGAPTDGPAPAADSTMEPVPPPPGSQPASNAPLIVVEQTTGGYAPGDPNAQAVPPPPPQAAYPAAPPPPSVVDGVRVRWGFTIFGGVASPIGADADSSGVGGVLGRIGVQINNTWGVYYQLGGIVGAYVVAGPGEAESNVFAAAWNTLMGSATLFHMLDFGLGVSVDSVASVSAAASSGDDPSASSTVYAGTTGGLHGRVALIFGRAPYDVPRRGGFAISLDLHNTFIEGDGLFTATLGLGGDWY